MVWTFFVANPMKAMGSSYVVQWLFCCIRTLEIPPPKINIEPENDGLEFGRWFSFSRGPVFSGSSRSSSGVYPWYCPTSIPGWKKALTTATSETAETNWGSRVQNTSVDVASTVVPQMLLKIFTCICGRVSRNLESGIIGSYPVDVQG